ncbi:MAG: FkbM family methyltransferase [Terracidiphilus sp.]
MPALRSGTRAIAIATLPKSLVSFIRNGRYRGYRAHVRYLLKRRSYRQRFLRANAAAPDATIVMPGRCSIRVPAEAAEVRDAFEYFGWKDPDAVDEFAGFMRAAAGRKTLWDVGALFGFFSLAFTLAENGRKALAFEPNPESCRRIRECLRLNPEADVDVYDMALGLPGEVVTFQSGFHFIAAVGLEVPPTHVAQIETASIDQLIESGFAAPDMMKIDVEGHEFDVLKGARKLLRERKPLLSLEVHPGALSHRGIPPIEVARYLEEAGYVFLDMRNRRVKREFFAHRDTFRVLAV